MVPGLILKIVKHKDTVPMAVRLPMIYGVLTVIAGLLMRGIIDIAGTDSPYIFIYFPVGSIIYLSSPVIAYIIGRKSASVQ